MNVAALKPAYMSVTYGAGGSTSKSTLDIAGDIQKDTMYALLHI